MLSVGIHPSPGTFCGNHEQTLEVGYIYIYVHIYIYMHGRKTSKTSINLVVATVGTTDCRGSVTTQKRNPSLNRTQVQLMRFLCMQLHSKLPSGDGLQWLPSEKLLVSDGNAR